MDPKRFKEAYEKLQLLDERMTYKLRPRSSGSLMQPTIEQLDERLATVSAYTVELKEIVEELFHSIAGKQPEG